jgi:hypothetical protein
MKMPEPIIDPMTSAVELNSPRLWTIPTAPGLGASGVGASGEQAGLGN